MYSRQMRILRNQNKLTQQSVADFLGISRSAYCGYETGRRSPDLDTVKRLSEFYHITPDKFFGEISQEYVYDDTYYEGQPDTRYLSQLSREERNMVVLFRMGSKAARELMIADCQKIIEDTKDKE